jgi:predicted lipoprotein with Yx(FWY)xxD motif
MFKLSLAALLLALGLTGCGNTQTNDKDMPSLAPEKTSAMDEGKTPALELRNTGLGEIIVDGKGRTVYTYEDDKQGTAKSSCKGACLKAWPAVPAPAKPDLDDLSGDAGVTKSADGDKQLTYNGWPLYYFAGDQKPGDTKGQGMEGEWYVLDKNGEKIETKQEQSSNY